MLPDWLRGILPTGSPPSQCTYRCVVLPDFVPMTLEEEDMWSQCTYRCVVLPDLSRVHMGGIRIYLSQCTYRCVVLPDRGTRLTRSLAATVSMHLQVRGAP